MGPEMAARRFLQDLTRDAWLELEGTRAARSGLTWKANPYLRPDNMPARTGDSPQDWGRKHDAWQRGFERQYEEELSSKERLSRELLACVVERRVRWIPDVRREMARDPMAILRVGMPYVHARDPLNRNWNVDGFVCGVLQTGDCEAAFRATADPLRDMYDIG